MAIPKDTMLYERVKKEADKIYKKPSAYKSGYIVKRYKELGGQYLEDGKVKGLKNWFDSKWQDVGNKPYPVYRPTKRINKSTPLLVSEIDPKNLRKQIALKQIIKGKSNLPPFKKKD